MVDAAFTTRTPPGRGSHASCLVVDTLAGYRTPSRPLPATPRTTPTTLRSPSRSRWISPSTRAVGSPPPVPHRLSAASASFLACRGRPLVWTWRQPAKNSRSCPTTSPCGCTSRSAPTRQPVSAVPVPACRPTASRAVRSPCGAGAPAGITNSSTTGACATSASVTSTLTAHRVLCSGFWLRDDSTGPSRQSD